MRANLIRDDGTIIVTIQLKHRERHSHADILDAFMTFVEPFCERDRDGKPRAIAVPSKGM